MLKIQLKEPYEKSLWIVEKNFTIGSHPQNNLVIEDESVSPKHARIVMQKGVFLLKDNNSEQGSYINGRKVSEMPIACDDKIRIGEIDIHVIDPAPELASRSASWCLVGSSGSISGQEFIIPSDKNRTLTLGRGRKCDICMPGTQLAREHIQLRVQGPTLYIKDLSSVTGTYINDVRMEELELKSGDRIRMDILTFNVYGHSYKVAPSKETFKQAIPVQHNKTSSKHPAAKLNKPKPQSLVDSSELDKLIGKAHQEPVKVAEKPKIKEKLDLRRKTKTNKINKERSKPAKARPESKISNRQETHKQGSGFIDQELDFSGLLDSSYGSEDHETGGKKYILLSVAFLVVAGIAAAYHFELLQPYL